jgi:RsiW-degrading membrane proteinase PrsW (M82 family)
VVVLWAIVEEGLKYLAVYLGGLRLSFYDEPVDAMIYMVTAALGFAAIENTLFILSALKGLGGVDYILTGNFRFLGATLVHIVASAIIGSVIGLSFGQSRLKRLSYFTVGFIFATMLHALFNYFIITTDSDLIFIIFGVLWLAGVLIIFLFERVKDSIIEKHFTSS